MNARLAFPAIGAVQGALLYWLYRAADGKFWPATDFSAFGLLGALACGAPALIYLSHATGMPARRRALLLALMVPAYALLGWYAGWLSGNWPVGDGPAHAGSVLGGAILGFVLVPLASGWNASTADVLWRWDYHRLYEIAWRNAVLCITTGVLTGIFWMVLMAGAALLKSLGLDAFFDLIKKPEFFIPATCIAAGEAFALGLSRAELLVALRRFWMTLTAWFLPLLLCFAVVWVIALPFTGLDELFATRMAAYFLLWFAALSIKFLNSAWQDGREAVYSTRLQTLVAALWLTLPVVVVVAGAALARRVMQYGWTDDRIWGAFVWLLVAGYVCGYAASWLPKLKRHGWMAGVGVTNVFVALVMCAGLVLLLSPVLDPRRVSVNDQMERLRSGVVKPDAFDYNYLRFGAGRWGEEALKQLAAQEGDDKAKDIAGRAKQALALKNGWQRLQEPVRQMDRDTALSRIRVLPKGAVLDESLLEKIRGPGADWTDRQCLGNERKCVVWMHDLDKDGKTDALFVTYDRPRNPPSVNLYTKIDNEWRRVATIQNLARADKWVEAIETGKMNLEYQRWPEMMVDGLRGRVYVQ